MAVRQFFSAGRPACRFDNGAAEEAHRLLDSGRPVLMQGGAQAYAALLGYRGNDFYCVSTFLTGLGHSGALLRGDQGFQYASHGYFTLTQSYGLTPSILRPESPYAIALAV